MRRHQKKYEEIGASNGIKVIFKCLKISVLDYLLDNIEIQHLQQISAEVKKNTEIDLSGTCVEFSKYSIPV